MSARNRKDAKKIRTLERALRKDRLPKWINLVDWLKDHGHADTAGGARKIIQEERVMVESHILGKTILEIPGPDEKLEKKEIFWPFVAASQRSSIHVVPKPNE